jgi:hypothetical protein
MSRVDIEKPAAYNETMETHPTTKPETLVAMNYDGAGDLAKVLAFLDAEGATISVETVQVQHFRDAGRFIETHRVTFDAWKVRNTHVHGVSFHAGFVSHIE